MSDVRLVGTDPSDGSLVPVAVTSAGLLKTQVGTIEEIPNDVTISGDLTVTGTINGDQGGSGLPEPYGPEGSYLTIKDGVPTWTDGGGAGPGPDPVDGSVVFEVSTQLDTYVRSMAIQNALEMDWVEDLNEFMQTASSWETPFNGELTGIGAKNTKYMTIKSVSYTHLTLPTICSV